MRRACLIKIAWFKESLLDWNRLFLAIIVSEWIIPLWLMRLERITRKHVAGVCLRVILPYHGALLWIHLSVCKSNVNELHLKHSNGYWLSGVSCALKYISISYIRHLGIHWNENQWETIHNRGPYPPALYVEDIHAMSGHIYAMFTQLITNSAWNKWREVCSDNGLNKLDKLIVAIRDLICR